MYLLEYNSNHTLQLLVPVVSLGLSNLLHYICRTSNKLTSENCSQHQKGYTYEGSWEHDKMCGLGKLSMADNSVYEGEFVDSKFHGKGSLTWPDGSRYDGH